MNISGVNQVFTYVSQNGCLTLSGNGNTLNLKDCRAIIRIMGEKNTINVVECEL